MARDGNTYSLEGAWFIKKFDDEHLILIKTDNGKAGGKVVEQNMIGKKEFAALVAFGNELLGVKKKKPKPAAKPKPKPAIKIPALLRRTKTATKKK